ncbi:hypothetical protein SCLCIDRAFT_1207155 [Scleroderma citrinum Foug A]|uniref:Uncharacterized protein n=1 Tax=Scleroderma citrinum Foug A TaxID=1036808 RepID=A0A0C3A878_9AGAM|nr:hypothetical protein SCLCIDRAFT_1207155 [Scleroderma citrinum Foug A]
MPDVIQVTTIWPSSSRGLSSFGSFVCGETMPGPDYHPGRKHYLLTMPFQPVMPSVTDIEHKNADFLSTSRFATLLGSVLVALCSGTNCVCSSIVIGPVLY